MILPARAWRAVVLLVPFGVVLLLNRLVRTRTSESLARALRGKLERLGGAFIPLGRALSLRRDVLPPIVCDVLEQVGAEVAPFDGGLAARTVESELGQPIDRLFASFDPSVLDASWDAQRHLALLTDSEPVVVSVRRPDISAVAHADLTIISVTLTVIDFTGLSGCTHLSADMGGLRQHVVEQLSMTTRGRAIDRLGAQTEKSPDEYVPHVYWSHMAEGVLTLESLQGRPLRELVDERRASIEPESPDSIELRTDYEQIARHLLHNWARQIIEGEYFVTNPDLGALTVIDDEVLAYSRLDHVNRTDARLRRRLIAVASALRSGETDVVFDAIVELIRPPADADLRELEWTLTQRLADWRDLANGSRESAAAPRVSTLVRQLLDDLRRRAIAVPLPVLLLSSSFATLERSVLHLAPHFDIGAELSEFFRAQMSARIQNRLNLVSLGELFLEYEEFLMAFPRHFLRSTYKEGRNGSTTAGSTVSDRVHQWQMLRAAVTAAMVIVIAGWTWLLIGLQTVRPAGAPVSTPKMVVSLLMLAVVRRVSTLGYNASAAKGR